MLPFFMTRLPVFACEEAIDDEPEQPLLASMAGPRFPFGIQSLGFRPAAIKPGKGPAVDSANERSDRLDERTSRRSDAKDAIA